VIAAALLLAAAAAGAGPVAAERAFAAMAQREGQWTAFRAFAAPEAIMFVPEAGNAREFLTGRADPPVSVIWWPGHSWIACDGSLAVNSGPWLRSGGASSGTFTTVWKRQPNGSWKWLLDQGHSTPKPVSAGDRPEIVRPACRSLAAAAEAPASDLPAPHLRVQLDDAMPGTQLPAMNADEGARIGGGQSADGSLRWEARAVKGDPGAHVLRLWTWDGAAMRLALFELSGVPGR
jgi:hypothetical protein